MDIFAIYLILKELKVLYLSFSGMPFHEIITFKLFFLIWHNSRHTEQESRPEVFHPEVRPVGVTMSWIELTRMKVMRVG